MPWGRKEKPKRFEVKFEEVFPGVSQEEVLACIDLWAKEMGARRMARVLNALFYEHGYVDSPAFEKDSKKGIAIESCLVAPDVRVTISFQRAAPMGQDLTQTQILARENWLPLVEALWDEIRDPSKLVWERVFPDRAEVDAHGILLDWLANLGAKDSHTLPNALVSRHGAPGADASARNADKVIVASIVAPQPEIHLRVVMLSPALRGSDSVEHLERARSNWSPLVEDLWNRVVHASPGLPY